MCIPGRSDVPVALLFTVVAALLCGNDIVVWPVDMGSDIVVGGDGFKVGRDGVIVGEDVVKIGGDWVVVGRDGIILGGDDIVVMGGGVLARGSPSKKIHRKLAVKITFFIFHIFITKHCLSL